MTKAEEEAKGSFEGVFRHELQLLLITNSLYVTYRNMWGFQHHHNIKETFHFSFLLSLLLMTVIISFMLVGTEISAFHLIEAFCCYKTDINSIGKCVIKTDWDLWKFQLEVWNVTIFNFLWFGHRITWKHFLLNMSEFYEIWYK